MYRKSRVSRRRRAPRRRSYRKRRTFSKKVKNVLMRIAEDKFFNVATTVSVTNTAPLLVSMTVPTQSAGNSTDQTRIGDTIFAKRVEVRIDIQCGLNCTVRVVIFKWKPSTTLGIPDVDDVLETGALAVGYFPSLPHKVDTKQEYRILYDRCFPMSLTGDTGVRSIHIFKKLGHKIQFDTNSNDGTSKVYLLLIQDSSTALGGHLYSRLHFNDS